MMPLNHLTSSPAHFCLLQSTFLLLICTFLAPLCTIVALISRLTSPFTKVTKHIKHHRRWRAASSAALRPRTVLVTGIGMSKGLSLARTFYRAGHRVIAADFEPDGFNVCGRFSTCIEKFYTLSKPSTDIGTAQYLKELIKIIEKEEVELWISCSGVASAIEDGEAAEAVEKETKCRAIQFGLTLTETLRDKHSFLDNTRMIGLNVPDTYLVTSVSEALAILYADKSNANEAKKYIMKSVGLGDSIRADMTLLPLSSLNETERHIRRLGLTPFRPFVLQMYIIGPKYCTHSLIIEGKVRAFVVSPSAERLRHYSALPASSALSRAMLLYTIIYAKKTSPSMTGHFSIDFIVDEQISHRAEARVGVSDIEVRELMNKIYAIECNPCTHTAVVLFTDESEDLAEAYLSILPDHEPIGHRDERIVVPKLDVPPYYCIGHDVVSLVLLPLLGVLRLEVGILEMLGSWAQFVEHVLYWRDVTFELWDPWPAWWLYVIYWPGMFVFSLQERKWWSRHHIPSTDVCTPKA